MHSKKLASILAVTMIGAMTFVGCGSNATSSEETVESASNLSESNSSGEFISKDDITINETIEESGDGTHAIEADGEDASYSNVKVVKTGDSEGDEADFYGENATIFATNGATLDLSEIVVESDGTHANGVFSYGEGTTVNISDSYIETSGNCSGGLMTTGGGTMNASNLTIVTSGNSSAAIRSDRGGGTVTVNGGSYTTSGTGSPAIYSTADITVSDATLTSTASQGVVVEGDNSVTLNNVILSADNNTKNSDKSEYYQAVMIYQSMSGDADEGIASFKMTDGSITNENGEIFFVTNTLASIELENVSITNNGDDVFYRASSAGWGSEGNNGGQANLYATNQTIDGDVLVDEVSALNLYLQSGSTFTGAINPDGQEGDVYVELTGDSKWSLTGDSYVTSLTCDADSIELNGYTLYINGEEYQEGTASTGEEIELTKPSGSGMGEGGQPPMGDMPEGEAPSGEKPDGEAPSGDKPSGDAPSGDKPSGQAPSGEKPADKPSNN